MQLHNTPFYSVYSVHIEQKNIYVPSDNVGTWRGFFEPSTVTFEAERKRARNIFVLYALYHVSKVLCNRITALQQLCHFQQQPL
jgi:hypothetical protein